jgi:hypothetical protein
VEVLANAGEMALGGPQRIIAGGKYIRRGWLRHSVSRRDLAFAAPPQAARMSANG